MKILIIAPYYSWFIKNLVEAESKYVNEINVLVHHNYLADISNFLPFGGYFEFIRQFSKKKLIDSTATPNNVNVRLISMVYFFPDGQNKRIGDKIVKKFEKYIRRHKIQFDLIHAHFTYPQGYAALKLGRIFDIPVVVTLHENLPHLHSLLEKQKGKISWVWKNSNALIRVNKKDFPIYLKAGVEKSRLHHIPNGFNPEQFPIVSKDLARKQINLETNKKIILNIARLSKEKGQIHLIEAMRIIIQNQKNVLCLIGGIGPLKDHIQKQIIKFGLEKYVRLCGYIPNEKIAFYMNAADIFVLPSLSEGNPVVMFEALGVGLPFIGTTVGGIPEIITTEDYGLLVEPANPKDLADKILKALERKWDHKNIALYAKSYSWENIAKQTLETYKMVKSSSYNGE